ncbi:MAG: hypothetical protein KG003_13960 [Bacteroidetes bacterium]|nr:hypothetical protein [Bacteroidota bacterium]
MRHQLVAKENVDERIGDHHFQVEKDQTIELSAKGAEVAMATGKFEYSSEVPETPIEKKRFQETEKGAAQERQKLVKEKLKPLLKLNKDELLAEAEKLNLENVSDLNKEPLALAIAEAQVGGNK